MPRKPFILFICRQNTGRSQMAEAYLQQFVGDTADIASAGTEAGEAPDAGVVQAMADDGIDISEARPKVLNPGMLGRATRIITMGCDVEGVMRVDEDWGLSDPKDQPPERVREIRDAVKAKARALADTLILSEQKV